MCHVHPMELEGPATPAGNPSLYEPVRQRPRVHAWIF